MKAYVVDSAAVRSNLQLLQTRAGSAVLWAVLKGDGYGLGLLPMAAICREAGVTHFAVTEVSEVSRLRAGGFADASILMLRPTSEQDELRQLLQLGAILTVSSQNDAAVLNGVAQELGVQAEVHVKIDTGMGRYGFLPDELDQLLPIFRYMPGLHVTGIYTHLHSAFCSQKATIAQAEAFQGVLDQLHAADCETGMAHMLNSAGLLKYPQYAMDGVRVGSAVLGRVSVRGNFGLTRIGECQATVEELRWLPKGHSCGYGAGWTAKKPTRVAVFSVGWYHGFGVEMGNDLFRFRDCLRGVLRNLRQMIFKKHITVTVNGKKCRVLGHIGMLHTCVDVTNVPCAVGDPAVFDLKPLLLKGIEGSIKYMTRQLKGIFMKNFKTKMAALAIKNEFYALKASLDPNEVGGTAMLGISKPVIKAHGSSDARAIYNAIRQAIAFVDSGIIDDITANISYMRVDKHAAKECD